MHRLLGPEGVAGALAVLESGAGEGVVQPSLMDSGLVSRGGRVAHHPHLTHPRFSYVGSSGSSGSAVDVLVGGGQMWGVHGGRHIDTFREGQDSPSRQDVCG